MENNLKFNSQVATNRQQSERLLALGLKKETADMGWQILSINGESVDIKTEDNWERQDVVKNHFPAWSLHRLMSMLTAKRKCLLVRIEADLYDALIDRIEHEIKEGYFNKEYLV